MELIIDSSNIEQIKELNDLLTITGGYDKSYNSYKIR